jgi:arginine/ornithine transport system permease protein
MPLYLGGLVTTLKLLALSLFFGLLCALPLGLMRVSKTLSSTDRLSTPT